MESGWEFWIDVGGTFTDCIARRPDGTLARHKLLSSGVTKGVARAGSMAAAIVDPARAAAPDGFWNGSRLRLLDAAGNSLGEAFVTAFDPRTSALQLQSRLPIAPHSEQPYELVAGEEAPVLAILWLLGLAA